MKVTPETDSITSHLISSLTRWHLFPSLATFPKSFSPFLRTLLCVTLDFCFAIRLHKFLFVVELSLSYATMLTEYKSQLINCLSY